MTQQLVFDQERVIGPLNQSGVADPLPYFMWKGEGKGLVSLADEVIMLVFYSLKENDAHID